MKKSLIQQIKDFEVNQRLAQHISASVFYSPHILILGHFLELDLLAYSFCLFIAISWELLQRFVWDGKNTLIQMFKGFFGLMIVPSIIYLCLNIMS